MCDRNLDDIPCRQKPCLPGPERTPSESSEDANANLKGRPVLYTGVVWIGIVRRFLIPRTCISSLPQDSRQTTSQEASAPQAVSHMQNVESATHEHPLRYTQRPVLVRTDQPQTEKAKGNVEVKGNPTVSPLGALVVQVHEVSAVAAAQARAISQDVTAILRDGQETTSEMINTVRSKDGRGYRMTAIAGSGLVGFLMGRKRGILTRLVYSVTGGTAMATICYPEEAKVYNRRSLAAVRRWIMLALSFIQSGPQKPVGKGDLKASNCANTTEGKEKTKLNDSNKSETTLYSTENVIENLKQNLGTLSHHLEEIRENLKESSGTTVKNKYTKSEKVPNSGASDDAAGGSLENRQSSNYDRFEKLSSKSNKNIMERLPPGAIPYSPAHPVPVDESPDRNKHNTTLGKQNNTLTQTPEENSSFIKNKTSKHSLYQNTENEGTYPLDEEQENYLSDNEDLEQEDDFDDFSETTFVIPTGGIEKKLECKIQRLDRTGCSKNDQTPLNKKLNAYYRNIPDEEKTSREKGYSDAYSNRGK